MPLELISVNCAAVSTVHIEGNEVRTAIGKQPVAGSVSVGLNGLAGDAQGDRDRHGGLARALYAYPAQHYAFWRTVRAQARVAGWGDDLPAGAMGENLTLGGISESALWIGDQLRGPGCTLVVGEPRLPGFKFNHSMGFAQASRLMVQSGYCGCFLAVLEPGVVTRGDQFELVPGPRELGLLELFRSRTRP